MSAFHIAEKGRGYDVNATESHFLVLPFLERESFGTLPQAFLIIMLAADFFLPLRLLGSFFHVAMKMCIRDSYKGKAMYCTGKTYTFRNGAAIDYDCYVADAAQALALIKYYEAKEDVYKRQP